MIRSGGSRSPSLGFARFSTNSTAGFCAQRSSAAALRWWQLTRKYGEFWNRSLTQLKKVRTQKENLLKEIKFQMELFNLHIQQGRDLCTKLSAMASHIKTAPAQLQPQLAIEVVSPILANSNNPLSTAR